MAGTEKTVRYGNWVSNQLIIKVLVTTVVLSFVTILLYTATPDKGVLAWGISLFLGLLTLLCLVSLLYFAYAKYQFSYTGGKVQNKILELLLSYIHWDGAGRALDIGCGSGALTIKLAKRYGNAQITGLDYWGGSWGYSREQCETNARLEGVAGRTTFTRASASRLPFPDEAFDLVVSNLTFHEVKDSKNKPDVVREALRVVKQGGLFAFQDLFLLESYYGKIDGLLAALKAEGVREVRFIDTSKADFIPSLARLPFMVGPISILYGVK